MSVFSCKNDVSKSHLGVCMVTRGHFITIKIFPGEEAGEGQEHGTAALWPPTPVVWRCPCLTELTWFSF